MANTSGNEHRQGGDETGARATERAERRDARIKKQASRTKKDGSERAVRICALGTIEVKKDSKGYQIIASGTDKRRSISVNTNEVGAMLKDLEAAIYVIRAEAGSAGR